MFFRKKLRVGDVYKDGYGDPYLITQSDPINNRYTGQLLTNNEFIKEHIKYFDRYGRPIANYIECLIMENEDG